VYVIKKYVDVAINITIRVCYYTSPNDYAIDMFFSNKDYCGDAAKYGHEIVPLKTSNSQLTLEDIADAAQPSGAFKWDSETDLKVDG